jgi:hypothetical protein
LDLLGLSAKWSRGEHGTTVLLFFFNFFSYLFISFTDCR